MKILVGIAVLVLLIWGLINRNKRRREWIQEERYEESGAWLDKRSGERGTYGSLDEEMERNRKWIRLQGQASELARSIQTTLATQLPDDQKPDPEQQKRHSEWLKAETKEFFSRLEDLKTGKTQPLNIPEATSLPLALMLKKQVLDFCYENFPELLHLEIEELKNLDLSCGLWCERILLKLTN